MAMIPDLSVTLYYKTDYLYWLQLQTVTDLITNFYWLHYKMLLTSLQTFTDFITNYYTDLITNLLGLP